MYKKEKGLYNKFIVKRTDGTDCVGGKHEHCNYFVLDCSHDIHAKAAIIAYANSCKESLPILSKDLQILADLMESNIDPIINT